MKTIVPIEQLCDDWVVLLLILSFVLVSVTIGSDMPQVLKSLRSMFNFKKSDGQLVYAPVSLFGLVRGSIHIAISVGTLVYIFTGSGLLTYTETPLRSVLSQSVLVLLFIVLKIILYISVNGIICSKHYIPSQHFRWISFYIMVQALNGAVALVLSLLVIYIHIPVQVAVIVYILLAILLEIGILFKLFSAFFKKKCSVLVFFIYLCALEIAPCILVWFLVK